MSQPALWKERQRQLREEAILESAHELLVDQGYSDMSMDDLAARVGVSKATLYQHFPSKEDVAIHVIARAVSRAKARVRALDPHLPAIVRLEMATRQAFEERASLWQATLPLSPAWVRSHPVYTTQMAGLVDAFASLVDEAKADGDVVADVPTLVIVHMLFGLYRADYSNLLAKEGISQSELVDMFVKMIFNGILAQSEKYAQKTEHHTKSMRSNS